MIPVCFHQRSYLLTACWRASTCWMGCLFSSSVLCLCIALSSILSPPSSPPFMMIPCSPCASTFDLPPLFISVTFFSAPSASHCALHFLCLSVSALCPVAEESRLGPSSVYVRVALRPAACLTRGLSLPGPATHTSALLLPWLRCNGPAGSRLLARH